LLLLLSVQVFAVVQGYKVYYTLTPLLPVSLWTVHEVNQNSLLTTISNLLTHRHYSLRVLAFTRSGDGPLSRIINVTTSTGIYDRKIFFVLKNFRPECKMCS